MAKPEKEEAEPEREGGTDGPLLDLSDDAVKKMIKAAKKRGYVTIDALNAVIPSESTSPDQIEDTLIFVQLEPMLGDQSGSDFEFVAKHGLYLGGCAGFFTFRGGVSLAIHV